MSDYYEEEEEEDFETSDDVIEFWEAKQRDVILNYIDYNLESIANLIEKKNIDISPKFQRRFRWNDKKQSALIESFLMNVPIPPIFLNEDEYGVYSVIDGKQRLNAIYRFLKGELTLIDLDVFPDLNNQKFKDMNIKFQKIITTRATIRAIIILRQSDPEIKFEVFKRLNTGGVHLNAQEIRNCSYQGTFNDLLIELSDIDLFLELVNIDRTSGIYAAMWNVELALIFFSIIDNQKGYSSSKELRIRLNKYMSSHQNMRKDTIVKYRKKFLKTIESANKIFGTNLIKFWRKSKWFKESRYMYSLYAINMYVSYKFRNKLENFNQTDFLEEYKNIIKQQSYQTIFSKRKRIPKEFSKAVEILEKIVEKHNKSE